MLEDKSGKYEFFSLLRIMEGMMRTDPTMLLNSPDYAEKVQRFNDLVQLVPTFNLSIDEIKEVQTLWNSLKLHIKKRAKKLEAKAQLTPQEQLIQALKDIITRWETASVFDKKELINEVHRLQLDPTVMAKMTPEQVQEYNELMTTIRGFSSVEQVSLEEYSELESSERRKFGIF